jgi:hypothetical protein
MLETRHECPVDKRRQAECTLRTGVPLGLALGEDWMMPVATTEIEIEAYRLNPVTHFGEYREIAEELKGAAEELKRQIDEICEGEDELGADELPPDLREVWEGELRDICDRREEAFGAIDKQATLRHIIWEGIYSWKSEVRHNRTRDDRDYLRNHQAYFNEEVFPYLKVGDLYVGDFFELGEGGGL